MPVDKETLCVDGVADKEVAEIASGTDYRGVLYNFSGTTSSKIGYSDTGYREPAYLIDSTNGDASKYNTIGLTQAILQDEMQLFKVSKKREDFISEDMRVV